MKPNKLWVEIYTHKALIDVFCWDFTSTTLNFQFLTACWRSMHAKMTHVQRAKWLTNDMMTDCYDQVSNVSIFAPRCPCYEVYDDYTAVMLAIFSVNFSAAAAAAAASRTRLAVAGLLMFSLTIVRLSLAKLRILSRFRLTD